MNGRVYDAVLGRFLSADPNVDGTDDAQGFNRYSYVGNNPLGATDPTGFFGLKDVFKIVAIVVIAYFTAGAALYAMGGGVTGLAAGATATFGNCLSAIAGTGGFGLTLGGAVAAGAGAGFASGFAGSLLNGGSLGDAFKAGVVGAVVGAVSGGLTHGIGGKFGEIGGKGWENEFGRAVAHGAVGGVIQEATGGEFRHGFYSSFAGSVAGSLAPKLGLPGYDNKEFSAVAKRTIFAAVVGGTTSALGGGKFANGAITSAFQHLLNAEGSRPSRSDAIDAANKLHAKMGIFFAKNPDASWELSDADLRTAMLVDAYFVQSRDLYMLGYADFNLALTGPEGDGFFYKNVGEAGSFAFRSFNYMGKIYTGGELNYYVQGMSIAARGWSESALWRVTAHNWAKLRFSDQQVTIRRYWATRGFFAYRNVTTSQGE